MGLKYKVFFALFLFLFILTTSAEAGEVFFTILHTNDEHSSLFPRGPAVDYHHEFEDGTVGGMARLATAIADIRAEKKRQDEPVLLLSGADYIGGAPFAWLVLHDQAPELKIMQEIGYDVVTIGNHEFDYGPEYLARYYQAAGYPEAHKRTILLSSNIISPPGHELKQAQIKQTYIRELENGLKIGFIGLIGWEAESFALNTGDVMILDFIEGAQKATALLLEQGVDIVVAITHAGVEEDRALARAIPAIDVIVGGHCHTALYEPVIEGNTIIVQAGSLVEYLGVLELAYNSERGSLRLRNQETKTPYLVKIDDSISPDPVIEGIVSGYIEEMDSLIQTMTGGRNWGLLEVVAGSEFTVPRTPELEETPLGNLVTDAMRLVASEKLGRRVDFAFQANGQIRGDLVPGQSVHARNLVSFYDLVELTSLGMGYDGSPGYPLVAFYLTGTEVRRVAEISAFLADYMGNTYFLQISGLRYEYDPRRAILFTVPVVNMPLPSGRAVLNVERYTGEGIQTTDDEDYVPVARDDDELYLVVCDSYILGFLPMVGELLPQLEVEPKDEDGNSLEDFAAAVIRADGKEVKVWQALVEFAMAQPLNEEGLSQLPAYYETVTERISGTWTVPLLAYPLLVLLLLIGGLVLLF